MLAIKKSTRQEIDQRLAELKRERRLAQTRLNRAKADFSDTTSEKKLDQIATTVVMEERHVTAFTEAIGELERTGQAAEAAEAEEQAEAAREAALQRAKKLFSDRMHIARDLHAVGKELSDLWQSFKDSEAAYDEACCAAGLEPKNFYHAIPSVVSGIVPEIVEELSRQHNFAPTRAGNAVRLLESYAPNRLRRAS
jgi:hypothetical protein